MESGNRVNDLIIILVRSRRRKTLQRAWQHDKREINLVTAGRVQVEGCLDPKVTLYLCRSCGRAAAWSQQGSCSGLLSPNHDMCYRSRHCSLHRSLQGHKHSQSDKPLEKYRVVAFLTYLFLAIKAGHSITGITVIIRSHIVTYITHSVCQTAEEIRRTSRFFLVKKRRRNEVREPSHKCNTWVRLTVRELKACLQKMKGDAPSEKL